MLVLIMTNTNNDSNTNNNGNTNTTQVSTAAWSDFSGTVHNLVLVGLQDGSWTVFDFNAESILGKYH